MITAMTSQAHHSTTDPGVRKTFWPLAAPCSATCAALHLSRVR